MADLEDLDRLAPDVDTDAALEEFRRRRVRAPRRWPVLAAVAVLAVVALAGVIFVASVGDDVSTVAGPSGGTADTPGPPSDPPSVDFQVLSVTDATEEMGTLRSAASAMEYDELLDQIGVDVAPLALVDFGSVVVVSVTIPDDSCPPTLERFDRSGDGTITPEFVDTAGGCRSPLIPKTFVVAIERESVPPTFVLRLPGDPTYGYDEQRLRVVVEPTCSEIEHFADQFVDVGIDRDASASQSPTDLLARSDLVFPGHLTGGFTDSTATPNGPGRVGYEVEIDALYKGPAEPNLAPLQTIFVNVGDIDPSDFEAAITPGIRVVVFAEYLRPDLRLLIAGIEGFVTGCPGGPLLGFTGTQGEWAEITDLDDLTSRLEALPDDG